MAYNVCQLVWGDVTVDLNDGDESALIEFAPVGADLLPTLARSPLAHGAELAFSRRDLAHYSISWQQKGDDHDALLNKIGLDLEPVLEAARQNQAYRLRGWQYTPVYFQFKPANATATAQTEVLYGEWQPARDAFGVPLRSNYFRDNALSLVCRPHLDGTTLNVAVNAESIDNGPNANFVEPVVGAGSSPMPTLITISDVSGGSDDRVLLGLRKLGDATKFVSAYELEDAALGSDTTVIDDGDEPNFSPGTGNVGIEYAPTTTGEVPIATIAIDDDVADQFGAFKVLVRAKGLTHRTIGLRVRAFAQVGSLAKQYGPYATLTFVKPAALNEIEMIDITPASALRVPPIAANGSALVKIGYEISAKSTDNTDSPKLRCDYLQLIPVAEGDGGSGALAVTFPVALNSAGIGSARFDTRDEQSRADLFDDSDPPVMGYSYSRKTGRGIFLPTSGATRLYVVLMTGANQVHDYTRTFTVSAFYLDRFIYVVGYQAGPA